jgi:hypothetical protein
MKSVIKMIFFFRNQKSKRVSVGKFKVSVENLIVYFYYCLPGSIGWGCGWRERERERASQPASSSSTTQKNKYLFIIKTLIDTTSTTHKLTTKTN